MPVWKKKGVLVTQRETQEQVAQDGVPGLRLLPHLEVHRVLVPPVCAAGPRCSPPRLRLRRVP